MINVKFNCNIFYQIPNVNTFMWMWSLFFLPPNSFFMLNLSHAARSVDKIITISSFTYK